MFMEQAQRALVRARILELGVGLALGGDRQFYSSGSDMETKECTQILGMALGIREEAKEAETKARTLIRELKEQSAKKPAPAAKKKTSKKP